LRYGLEYLEKHASNVLGGGLGRLLKTIIQKLSIKVNEDFKIEEGERHRIMISLANPILFRHSRKYDEPMLREFYEKINDQLCSPEGLPEREIDSMWNSAISFVEQNIKEQQQEQYNNNNAEADADAEGDGERSIRKRSS
jgi:hypothetical protein